MIFQVEEQASTLSETSVQPLKQILEQIRTYNPGNPSELIGKLMALELELTERFKHITPHIEYINYKKLGNILSPIAHELEDTFEQIQADNRLRIPEKLMGELATIAEEFRQSFRWSISAETLPNVITSTKKLANRLEQIRTDETLVPPYVLLANRLRVDKTLEVLDLSHCNLSPYAITIIMHSIKNHPLRSLNLSNNRGLSATSKGSKERGINSIACFLEHNRTLQSLNLSNTNLVEHTDVQACFSIFQRLGSFIQTSGLVELDLSNTGINATFLSALAPGLEGDTRLEILNLSHNKFSSLYSFGSSDCFSDFIKTLEKNRVLRILLLNNIEITAYSAKPLVDALKPNLVLEKVTLTNNPFEQQHGVGALVSSLETNWTLPLWLDTKQLSETQIQKLETRFERITRWSINSGGAAVFIRFMQANANSQLKYSIVPLIKVIQKMVVGDTPIMAFIQKMEREGVPINAIEESARNTTSFTFSKMPRIKDKDLCGLLNTRFYRSHFGGPVSSWTEVFDRPFIPNIIFEEDYKSMKLFYSCDTIKTTGPLPCYRINIRYSSEETWGEIVLTKEFSWYVDENKIKEKAKNETGISEYLVDPSIPEHPSGQLGWRLHTQSWRDEKMDEYNKKFQSYYQTCIQNREKRGKLDARIAQLKEEEFCTYSFNRKINDLFKEAKKLIADRPAVSHRDQGDVKHRQEQIECGMLPLPQPITPLDNNDASKTITTQFDMQRVVVVASANTESSTPKQSDIEIVIPRP